MIRFFWLSSVRDLGTALAAIPTGIGNGGKLHRLTSMSIAVHFLLSLFHQTTSISLTT